MAQATWIDADGIAVRNGALVYAAYLVSVAGGAASATIYHGRRPEGSVLVLLNAAASTSQGVDLRPGIAAPDGLYVDLDANSAGVLVLWDALA